VVGRYGKGYHCRCRSKRLCGIYIAGLKLPFARGFGFPLSVDGLSAVVRRRSSSAASCLQSPNRNYFSATGLEVFKYVVAPAQYSYRQHGESVCTVVETGKPFDDKQSQLALVGVWRHHYSPGRYFFGDCL
jgi:hypothetical protein